MPEKKLVNAEDRKLDREYIEYLEEKGDLDPIQEALCNRLRQNLETLDAVEAWLEGKKKLPYLDSMNPEVLVENILDFIRNPKEVLPTPQPNPKADNPIEKEKAG